MNRIATQETRESLVGIVNDEPSVNKPWVESAMHIPNRPYAEEQRTCAQIYERISHYHPRR
jgi:hypothetical protein